MNEKVAGVVLRANDYREYDKQLQLITPLGSRYALMRGVKKGGAKLKFAAMPFAFCEFTLVRRGESYIVTGAAQIEDLFTITSDTQKLVSGSLILQAAFCALSQKCQEQFLFMLRRLKDIIYSDSHPYLAAVRFFQYIIHDAGYGYEYKKIQGKIDTPIKLLSALWFLPKDKEPKIEVDFGLIKLTLKKLVQNFEAKFETEILAKKLLD